ncbi:minor capsid protein [Sediminibacillus massiliensis]|uniref:minor capsid protein n=1 Tax=Sediminibacillus massiliensis TaxID=1926277 RepID=UPI00098875B9|nr:minor capsid protein [Sediminibacillus massiliensis]
MSEEESYWVKREKDNIKREQMKDEEVNQKLETIINRALKDAEKDIRDFYSRYAAKNKMTPEEAKKEISNFDVKAFEKTAAKYVKDKNFSDRANQELYTYNTKMRINRQELLMMYLNAHLVVMANDQIKTFQEYLEQAGIAEVARQAGILGADIIISSETLLSLVGASFYDATWSSRIWDDMHALREELEIVVNSSIVRGRHPDRFIPEIRERFDVTKFEARRLLITETARVQSESQKLSFEAVSEDEPDAEYEFVAMMDNKTSKRCRDLNGKRFKVRNMKPGVNAAPMHPFCRSSAALLPPDNWREDFFAKREGKYTL